MSATKVQFHFNMANDSVESDVLEIDAGAGLISLEIIPKLKQVNEEHRTKEIYLTLEPDEVDLLCSTLQLFKNRVLEGRYP